MTALTLRESEVMDLLAADLSREQIAERLRITPRAVKWHIDNARAKCNTSSTLAAAVKLERQRWQTA